MSGPFPPLLSELSRAGFPVSGRFLRSRNPDWPPSTGPRSTGRPKWANRRWRRATDAHAAAIALVEPIAALNLPEVPARIEQLARRLSALGLSAAPEARRGIARGCPLAPALSQRKPRLRTADHPAFTDRKPSQGTGVQYGRTPPPGDQRPRRAAAGATLGRAEVWRPVSRPDFSGV